jgi:hypothetical protein
MDSGETMARVPTGRHPEGEYHLTGATPAPPRTRFAELAAETSAMEHLIREALVEQERRLMMRIEQKGQLEESAALTMARRSARRRGAWATSLGVALGVTVTVFATAWSAFRETRQVAETAAQQVASDVVDVKTAPDRVQSVTNTVRIAAVEERQSALESEVGQIRTATDRILELLEPPTAVRVPKRPR